MHLLQLHQTDDSGGEIQKVFTRLSLQGALIYVAVTEGTFAAAGGVNHLQGEEEFTNHSASPLIQEDPDRNPIHVVKPRVLTNRKTSTPRPSAEHRTEERERVRTRAGRGMLGMTTKRKSTCCV